MKLKDVFIKFFSPATQEEKWVSLEHILVFQVEILDSKDNKMTRISDDLYAWTNTSRGWMFIPIASFNVYSADKKG